MESIEEQVSKHFEELTRAGHMSHYEYSFQMIKDCIRNNYPAEGREWAVKHVRVARILFETRSDLL